MAEEFVSDYEGNIISDYENAWLVNSETLAEDKTVKVADYDGNIIADYEGFELADREMVSTIFNPFFCENQKLTLSMITESTATNTKNRVKLIDNDFNYLYAGSSAPSALYFDMNGVDFDTICILNHNLKKFSIDAGNSSDYSDSEAVFYTENLTNDKNHLIIEGGIQGADFNKRYFVLKIDELQSGESIAKIGQIIMTKKLYTIPDTYYAEARIEGVTSSYLTKTHNNTYSKTTIKDGNTFYFEIDLISQAERQEYFTLFEYNKTAPLFFIYIPKYNDSWNGICGYYHIDKFEIHNEVNDLAENDGYYGSFELFPAGNFNTTYNESCYKGWRKVWIRRRLIDQVERQFYTDPGGYETLKDSFENDGYRSAEFIDITKYVIEFPKLKTSFGDINLKNEIDIESMTMKVDNSTRKFADIEDNLSLFFGFKSRCFTQVYIEIGKGDYSQSNAIASWAGFIYGDVEMLDDGVCEIPLVNCLKIFELLTLEGILSTASNIDNLIRRMYNLQKNDRYKIPDGMFLNNTNIDSYALSITPIFNAEDTIWKKIKDFCIYTDSIVYTSFEQEKIPETFGVPTFNFTSKSVAVSSSYTFIGGAITEQEIGCNIISIDKYYKDSANFYSTVKVNYNGGSYTAETSWTPGDGSDVDLYGEKSVTYDFTELNLAQATEVAERIRDTSNTAKKRLEMTTILNNVTIKDKVTVIYKGYSSSDDSWVMGMSAFPVTFNNYLGSVYIDNIDFMVISVEHDPMNFTTKLVLEEV